VGEAPSRFCECFENRLRLKQYEDGSMADEREQSFDTFDENRIPEENKGICGIIKLDVIEADGSINSSLPSRKSGWMNISLPIKSEALDKIDWSKGGRDNRPAFFYGEFDAIAGIDTFINTEGWEKGCIFINGFNIGITSCTIAIYGSHAIIIRGIGLNTTNLQRVISYLLIIVPTDSCSEICVFGYIHTIGRSIGHFIPGQIKSRTIYIMCIYRIRSVRHIFAIYTRHRVYCAIYIFLI
jgi:hypothetical protein